MINNRSISWIGICFLLFITTSLIYAQRPEPIEKPTETQIVDSLDREKTNVEYFITEAMHFLAIENMPKALEKFQKAYELMPDNAAINSRMAMIYKQDDLLDKSRFHAEQAYKNDPKNHFYASLLANVLTEQGELGAAIDVFEQLYKSNPDAPDDYLLELAALYLYEGESKNALETYDRIEKRLGVLEEVSVQKQKILLQENDLKGALAEGDKLVKAYPNVGAYAVDQAQMLVSNDRLSEAISYLEEYLENYPNQPRAHLKIAELYQQENNAEQVSIHLKKAFISEEISLRDKLNNYIPLFKTVRDTSLLVELGESLIRVHPNEANAFAAYGDMYFNYGIRDKALQNYRKAVGYNASNLQLWQNILNLELELNNYKKVAQYAEEALSYFPNQPVLYLYAGTGYFSLKEYEKAIRNWRQGAAITFGNDGLKSTFHAQMADAYHAAGELNNSFEQYEKAIQFNLNNYFAINNYTYYLSLEKRDLEKAKRLAKRMVEANPNNATFIDTYGWVLFQKGDYKAAVEQLEKAVAINPSTTIVEHYGDALYKAGKIKEAIIQWERAQQLGAKSSTLKRKIEEEKYYE